MTDPQLQLLRKQVLADDPAAMRYVFGQTRNYCVGTLIKKTGCTAEDAEDLYMDALLLFREKLLSGKLRYLSNLRTYMFGICLNLWRNLERARQKWQYEPNETERQLWLLMAEEEAPVLLQEEENEQRHLLGRIAAALNSLGETCRKLLLYAYVDELPHKEIAERLNLASANVVKVTRHRCYQQWLNAIETGKNPKHEA